VPLLGQRFLDELAEATLVLDYQHLHGTFLP